MQHDEQLPKTYVKPKSSLLNKEEWNKHIQAWKDSGLSQKAFCERQGLNFNTFYYLRSKLLAKQKQSKPVEFAPVKLVNDTTSVGQHLTMENKHGVKLHLPLYLADQELLRVLKLLGW